MLLQNQNSNQAKSFAIKSIMKNPKLAKAMIDAWNAPPGSTKKTKARAILRSLEKSKSNYDGMGGYSPYSALSYSPGIQPPINVGQGPMTSAETPMSVASEPATPAVTVPGQTNEGVTSEPVAPKQTKFIKGIDDIVAEKGRGSYIPNPDYLKYYSPDELMPYQPGDKIYLKAGVPERWPGGKDTFEAGFQEPTATFEDIQNISDAGGSTELDQWYMSLDPSLQDYYKDAYEAVKIGVGPSTWAMGVLGDKEQLANILKVPVETLDMFPTSGLLSDQLNDLKNRIDEQFKIDNQLEKIMTLKNRGLTIENDLTAYIKGKDEYLGKIDKMIDEAESTIANMDTSNPHVAKRMGNYLNYLNILQGRQNQRYIDFLKIGVDQHNAELERATNLFDLSLTRAEKDYNQLASVTKESYDTLKVMLEDMYDNIEERTELLRENVRWENEQDDAALDLSYKTLRNSLEKEKLTEEKFEKVTPSDIREAREALNNVRGADGKVPTEIWAKLRSEWNEKFGAGEFDDYFPAKEELNPSDPNAINYFLTANQAAAKALEGDTGYEDLIP